MTAAPATRTFRDYFGRLFEYDRWANGLVLDAMSSLGEPPRKPLDRLSHLIVCQRLWLSRMTDDVTPPEAIFPTWPLERARDEAGPIFESMRRFVDDLPEEEFHQPFSYRSSEGDDYTNLRSEILSQLATHGCYHRGQIAVELNPLLPEPLTTDLVFFTRRPRR